MKILSYKEVNNTSDGIHAVVTYKRWFSRPKTIDVVCIKNDGYKYDQASFGSNRYRFYKWINIKTNYVFGWRFDRAITTYDAKKKRDDMIASISKCPDISTIP